MLIRSSRSKTCKNRVISLSKCKLNYSLCLLQTSYRDLAPTRYYIIHNSYKSFAREFKLSFCYLKSSGMKVILIIVLFAKSSLELSFNGTCPTDFECYNPKINMYVNDVSFKLRQLYATIRSSFPVFRCLVLPGLVLHLLRQQYKMLLWQDVSDVQSQRIYRYSTWHRHNVGNQLFINQHMQI